jgi:hypothetical protein
MPWRASLSDLFAAWRRRGSICRRFAIGWLTPAVVETRAERHGAAGASARAPSPTAMAPWRR